MDTLMTDAPAFEIIEGYQFSRGERVFVIDPNGFDLWEGVISSVNKGIPTIRYLDGDAIDEKISDKSRILAKTETNQEIFDSQEAIREDYLQKLSSAEVKQTGPLGSPENRGYLITVGSTGFASQGGHIAALQLLYVLAARGVSPNNITV
jgi:hypothetical protein